MSGEDRVANAPSPAFAPAVGHYHRSRANIRRLSELLPQELVVNLAREVILRVASKTPAEDVAQQDLQTLCDALISDDEQAAAKIIFDLRAEGMKPNQIYLKKLAAAARMLGEKWESDELSFAQVTVGTVRIFAIMRSMRHLFEPDVSVLDKTAVFAAVPGEDHTLGVQMAADLFRKDGWEIELKLGLDQNQLVEEIEKSPSRIVGLSFGGEHSIDALSRLVVALQICRPQVKVFVCGSSIDAALPILSLMELDGIATSAEEAQSQMTAMWNAKIAR